MRIRSNAATPTPPVVVALRRFGPTPGLLRSAALSGASRRIELYVEPTLPGWWDRVVIVATVVSLGIIAVDMALDPRSQPARVLGWVDLGFCALFLVDFGLRLRRATAKAEFVRRNWVDLLGAVPILGPMRVARSVRLLRLLRLARILALSRRILRRYDESLPLETLGHLALVAFGFWFFAAGAFYLFEHGKNANVAGFDDALWWSMTTLSTVGYGDMFPTTEGGRVVALVTMVLGVGVLATLAGAIATVLIEVRDRGRRGLRRMRVKNHLLVLGWNEKAAAAVADFRKDPRHRNTSIVVLADLEHAPIEGPDIGFVRGAPTLREGLERANAAEAAVAILFPSNESDPRSDHESALAAMTLRRLNPSVRLSVELVDPVNRELVEHAGCDAIVDRATLTSLMLVRTVQDLGAAEILDDLLRNDGGSELYRTPIDDRFIGGTFGEFAKAMVDKSCSVVAVARRGSEGAAGQAGREEYLVNPEPGFELRAGDQAFVVSRR